MGVKTGLGFVKQGEVRRHGDASRQCKVRNQGGGAHTGLRLMNFTDTRERNIVITLEQRLP